MPPASIAALEVLAAADLVSRLSSRFFAWAGQDRRPAKTINVSGKARRDKQLLRSPECVFMNALNAVNGTLVHYRFANNDPAVTRFGEFQRFAAGYGQFIGFVILAEFDGGLVTGHADAEVFQFDADL
jgi:hypothetical protein